MPTIQRFGFGHELRECKQAFSDAYPGHTNMPNTFFLDDCCSAVYVRRHPVSTEWSWLNIKQESQQLQCS